MTQGCGSLRADTALDTHRTLPRRDAWRLWSLWRELVAAVPEVTLTTPRGRCTELLFPPVPHDVLAYRKVIEIRDALLELGHYIPPYASETSGVETRRTAVSGSAADIGRLSARVEEALAAKLNGGLGIGARRQTSSPPARTSAARGTSSSPCPRHTGRVPRGCRPRPPAGSEGTAPSPRTAPRGGPLPRGRERRARPVAHLVRNARWRPDLQNPLRSVVAPCPVGGYSHRAALLARA
ncbi:DUF6545 domain-containing protein [Streptomyces melanosporofaciens]|uniref:DUF6545 domain-containing protein n=1 Tax=Streptomyces melanosporofaciens TaxID=67327 RepID=UPI003CC7A8E7